MHLDCGPARRWCNGGPGRRRRSAWHSGAAGSPRARRRRRPAAAASARRRARRGGWRASGVSHQASAGVAAIAGRRRRLVAAFRLARRAAQADMHVAVVAAPGADPAQPGGARRRPAQLALDGVVTSTRSTPGCSAARRISAAWPGARPRDRRRTRRAGPGRRPRISSRPPAGAAAWATGRARYRHPARPGGWHGHRAAGRRAAGRGRRSRAAGSPGGGPGAGEAAQPVDQRRMAPVAVAGEPHRLPARPIRRQCHRPGEAAEAGAADAAGRARQRGPHRRPSWPARRRLAPRPGSARRRQQAGGKQRRAADGSEPPLEDGDHVAGLDQRFTRGAVFHRPAIGADAGDREIILDRPVIEAAGDGHRGERWSSPADRGIGRRVPPCRARRPAGR